MLNPVHLLTEALNSAASCKGSFLTPGQGTVFQHLRTEKRKEKAESMALSSHDL